MKMTAKCLIARIFPAPKPYAVAILVAPRKGCVD